MSTANHSLPFHKAICKSSKYLLSIYSKYWTSILYQYTDLPSFQFILSKSLLRAHRHLFVIYNRLIVVLCSYVVSLCAGLHSRQPIINVSLIESVAIIATQKLSIKIIHQIMVMMESRVWYRNTWQWCSGFIQSNIVSCAKSIHHVLEAPLAAHFGELFVMWSNKMDRMIVVSTIVILHLKHCSLNVLLDISSMSDGMEKDLYAAMIMTAAASR